MNQDNHRILFGGKVIDISDPDLRGRIRVKPEWEQYQQIVSSLKDIFIKKSNFFIEVKFIFLIKIAKEYGIVLPMIFQNGLFHQKIG